MATLHNFSQLWGIETGAGVIRFTRVGGHQESCLLLLTSPLGTQWKQRDALKVSKWPPRRRAGDLSPGSSLTPAQAVGARPAPCSPCSLLPTPPAPLRPLRPLLPLRPCALCTPAPPAPCSLRSLLPLRPLLPCVPCAPCSCCSPAPPAPPAPPV